MTDRFTFVDMFGGVFEHSPWIAERAFDHGRIAEPLRAESVHECHVRGVPRRQPCGAP
jgi:2-oxo-4-hydroxy-4-carboxy-5-ureidoimidazoline decarboxylase